MPLVDGFCGFSKAGGISGKKWNDMTRNCSGVPPSQTFTSLHPYRLPEDKHGAFVWFHHNLQKMSRLQPCSKPQELFIRFPSRDMMASLNYVLYISTRAVNLPLKGPAPNGIISPSCPVTMAENKIPHHSLHWHFCVQPPTKMSLLVGIKPPTKMLMQGPLPS